MDDIGELDRILDEEHRDVVADEVPVALLRVELHCEAADVTGEVRGPLAARDCREPNERGRALTSALEQICARDGGQGLVVLEVPVGAVAAGVHDAFGDALVVEVEDLLAEVEVLEQRGPTVSRSQRVLVVRDRHTLSGRQSVADSVRDLMRLPTGPRKISR